MPLPSGWSQPVNTLDLLILEERSAGTYASSDVFEDFSASANNAALWVYVSAISGTPTLDCSLEASADGVTWAAVDGSAIGTLATAGNAISNCSVPDTTNHLRVTSTVSGSDTPTVTYRAFVSLNVSD